LKEYYKIKDNCRAGLLKYLSQAVTLLPKINDPKVLDIWCGTGVPTIWLAENYGGAITANDTDQAAPGIKKGSSTNCLRFSQPEVCLRNRGCPNKARCKRTF